MNTWKRIVLQASVACAFVKIPSSPKKRRLNQMLQPEEKSKWNLEMSQAAANTINPIRNIVDKLRPTHLPPGKEWISLSIGDPTKYPNLPTPVNVVNAVKKVLQEGAHNGYPPSSGTDTCKRAIATRFSVPDNELDVGDVFLASGCSGALDLTVTALANPGDNILIPQPGFSLYTTLCGRYQIEPRYYHLLPETEWQADLEQLESLIDENTKAILINNPSNPCGSIFTRENLEGIIAVAARHFIPIIADEIYANMVFGHGEYIPVASLTTDVPIISVGGLAKQYLVPGWRVGWVLVYDQNHVADAVRDSLLNLTMLILGPNSLIQGAVPSILEDTPQEFYDDLNQSLGEQSETLSAELATIPVLQPIRAHGAMYLMTAIDMDKLDLENDVEFASLLVREEAIGVLPGSIFGQPNYFRCVVCPPREKLVEAAGRIREFCARHAAGDGVERMAVD